MIRNTLIITLILIAGGVGYLLLSLDGTLKDDPEQSFVVAPQETTPAIRQAPVQDSSEDEKRIARMRAEYAELELARDAMRRQLGKLKARVWKLQVPPGQARVIREQMQQGYAALKNPPMLGAFSSVADISKDLARTKEISNKLKTLEITVQEYIAAQDKR